MIISQQFNEGYKHGRADARITEKKECRWINVNNITHKHDDWILGWAMGFTAQRNEMMIDGEIK